MLRRTKYLLILLMALALVAAACGSDSDDSDSSSDATEEPAEDEAEPEEEAEESAEEEEAAAEEPAEEEAAAEEPAEEEMEEEESSARDEFVALPDVPGVTDEEIKFASIATKENNPLGTDIKDAYNEGIKAYFDWRNGEGGIYGRQLVLDQELDDELSMNQQRSNEIVASDDVFASFSATLVPAGWDTLEDAGLPVFAWGIHAAPAAGKEYIFSSAGVTCTTGCTGRAVPYMAQMSGATKAAALGYGVSENSRICTVAQGESYAQYQADTGVEAVYVNDNLEFGLPNGIAVEVSEMKDAGVEFIGTCMDLNGMKTLAQELERQGMTDVTMYHPNTYNQSFVAEADPLFEGDFVVPGFTPFESDVNLETQDKYFEFMEARGVEPSELAMTGWINADQAFSGLLAAGPEFSRQAITDAGNAFTAYSAGGLLNPIDWTRQKEAPTQDDPVTNGYVLECFTPTLVVDAAFETVADPATPWLCWENADKSWYEPVPTTFGDS